MGTGQRTLQDHRRRQELPEIDQGSADLQCRPNRDRLLPQESQHRFCDCRVGKDRHGAAARPSQRGPGTGGTPPTPPAERGPPADRPYGAVLGGQPENIQDRQGHDGFQYGGVYKSTDGGESWTRINSLNPRPMYFSCIRVDPSDDKYVYVLGISMYRSKDGGKTFQGDAGREVHAE